jgi:hypothetical protein
MCKGPEVGRSFLSKNRKKPVSFSRERSGETGEVNRCQYSATMSELLKTKIFYVLLEALSAEVGRS